MFHLNMEKSFLTVRVPNYWQRFPGQVVVSPSSEIFKTHLDVILCNLLKVTLFEQGSWAR